ncbi:MAG TPA: hypothetical protein VFD72_01465 [Sphingobacteriaceae bacterium]|nr:hypothetical protein [Sphingobacteriaceae bacterium]
MDTLIMEKQAEQDYLHTLRNRMMALRANIEECPLAGDLTLKYGCDYYQEEIRSMGLRMMKEGLNEEGEKLILNYTREHYPEFVESEKIWISKMMRYANAITDTLIDNLRGEGFLGIQSNTDLPNENALFQPVRSLSEIKDQDWQLGLQTFIPLTEEIDTKKLPGYLYFKFELHPGPTV